MNFPIYKESFSNIVCNQFDEFYCWIQEEDWDFTKVDSIPDSAIVEAIGICWHDRPNDNLRDIFSALFNERGSGDWLDSGILTYSFRGTQVKQKWTSRFLVPQHSKDIDSLTPTLTVTWYDPNSFQGGTAEVASPKFGKSIKKIEPKNNRSKERRHDSVKVNSSRSLQNMSKYYLNPLASKWDEESSATFSEPLVDEFVKSDTSIILDAEPIQLINKSENSLSIQKGVSYSLGYVNGKPLHAILMEGGGIDTNFSPRIFKSAHSPRNLVTSEQLDSLEIKLSYTREEHNEAQRRTTVLSVLYDIAEGKLTTDYFNESLYVKHFESFASHIGLNLEKPFFLNGKSFHYSHESLVRL